MPVTTHGASHWFADYGPTFGSHMTSPIQRTSVRNLTKCEYCEESLAVFRVTDTVVSIRANVRLIPCIVVPAEVIT